MKRSTWLLSILLVCGFGARANELRVSSKEPVVVVAPDQWKSTKDKSPSDAFPFETYRVEAPGGRNAVCLISIYDKDNPKFKEPQFLKDLLRADSRPYVGSPDELSKIEVKELKIDGGLGFYANFVDPDLVGKPAKPGDYKTASPIVLSLGSKYLMKATILCDEINGVDYREAFKIVESIRIKKE
jgi:hypothetical protein